MDNLDLDDLCAGIGYTATRIIAAWFGGCDFYAPSQYRADHPLRFLIGDSALQALVKHFAGERLRIPHVSEDARYRRDRVTAEMLANGCSPEAIGQFLELSPRRVEQLRVELEQRGWLNYVDAPRLRARGRPTAEAARGTPDLVLRTGAPDTLG